MSLALNGIPSLSAERTLSGRKYDQNYSTMSVFVPATKANTSARHLADSSPSDSDTRVQCVKRQGTDWMPITPKTGALFHAYSQQTYANEAARLRAHAASTTTARIRARLLEEAASQERLAGEVNAGQTGFATPALRSPYARER